MRPGFDLESLYERYERKYSPDQPRDDQGRWTSEDGAGFSGSATPASETIAGSGRSDPRVLSDAMPDNS